jgi:hypothetical protein
MKISLVFILFLLFVSCNNTPQPNVVSRLEDPPKSELDSIKNLSINANAKRAIAIRESKSLIYIHHGLIGIYIGTIGDKAFKLSIDKTTGDIAEGFVMVGNEKKTVKGKIMKLAVEPSTSGKLTIYRLVLSDIQNTKMKGEYNITLSISPNSNTGEGNWIARNRKEESPIVIKERTI